MKTERAQTVSCDQNGMCYDLISSFKGITGVPVLLNTAVNDNEPVVYTPAEAIDRFERTKTDVLGMGSLRLGKDGAR